MPRATEEKHSKVCLVHDSEVRLSPFSLSMHMHVHVPRKPPILALRSSS